MLRYISVFLVLSWASILQAEEGPRYDETVQFLQNKLNVGNFRFVELDHCLFATGFIYDNGITVFPLPASTLDPSRIEVRPSDDRSSVRLNSFENKKNLYQFPMNRAEHSLDGQNRLCDTPMLGVVFSNPSIMELHDIQNNSQRCYSDSSRVRNGRNFRLVFVYREPTEENAYRVSRAFRHLIELCGGQEELF